MTNLPARPIYLGFGFGHSATLEKTSTGGRLVIRGPRGVAPVIVDVTVTEAGASVRMRDEPLSASGIRSRPLPAFPTPPPLHAPVSTLESAPTIVPAEPATFPSPEIDSAPRTRLTLLEYATLRAACVNAPPEQIPTLRSRYLLDEDGDAAETEGWSRRFKQDPTLFAAYKHYFQLFRSGTVSSPAVPAVCK